MEAIRIGGTDINNTKFADDTVLMAGTEEKLQRLLDVLNEVYQRYGLNINIEKTDVMGVRKTSEQLTQYRHWWSNFEEN